jgi:hypothetical protein
LLLLVAVVVVQAQPVAAVQVVCFIYHLRL